MLVLRHTIQEKIMDRKIVHVVGGGTISHFRTHLALTAPAYGGTARLIADLCHKHDETMDIVLHLTRMADHTSRIETNADLGALADSIIKDPRSKIVFFNPAVVDFDGVIDA